MKAVAVITVVSLLSVAAHAGTDWYHTGGALWHAKGSLIVDEESQSYDLLHSVSGPTAEADDSVYGPRGSALSKFRSFTALNDLESRVNLDISSTLIASSVGLNAYATASLPSYFVAFTVDLASVVRAANLGVAHRIGRLENTVITSSQLIPVNPVDNPYYASTFSLAPGTYVVYNDAPLTVSYASTGPSGYSYAAATLDLEIKAAPVPEPASMTVLGLGAAALLRRRRKA